MRTATNPDNNNPPRCGRGPSGRGRQIIDMRGLGAKQVTIALRLDVSLGAVKQCLRRHRRRSSIRTPEDANVSSIVEQKGLD
jgi:hypothetical protein